LSQRPAMWRFIVPGVLFVALVAFFSIGLWRDKETLPSPLIGKPAPQFELARLDDPARTISNREFAGQVYVLNVWGSWCVACRDEHPALLRIQRRGEVPIVGLNWNDDRSAAQSWLRELGDPYTVSAFDGEGRVAIDWGVYGAPETFLVDTTGHIIYKRVGPLDLEIWQRDFVPLIERAKAGQK
jgi:cytochrome c biogenesis protein CcmG, thiol:disulfide interchange protein DsbE